MIMINSRHIVYGRHVTFHDLDRHGAQNAFGGNGIIKIDPCLQFNIFSNDF